MYLHATREVRRLPEFRTWSRSHSFPVTFGAPSDTQRLVAGKCYWSVSVYAARPERLELWHIFYVRQSRKVELIQDPVNGEPVSLAAWRKQGDPARMKK